MDKGSVDLVFADPPFNIGYSYDVYDDKRTEDEYLSWSRQWIRGVYDCLSPSGSFWLAIGDEYAAELKIAAQEIGFASRSWVIWYYTFGVNCVRGFSRSHTHLLHFVKDPGSFTFNVNNPAIRVPSARQLVYADARANPKGRLPDNTWVFRPQDAPYAFAPNHDIWYFARIAGTFHERQGFHGCQMPEQLLGRIIRISSNPRDVVLDPFSGSGTTLSVAKKLGRQWIGFELSEEYARNIQSRLDGIRVGDELSGPADPLKSAPSLAEGKSKFTHSSGNNIPLPKVDAETELEVIYAFEAVSEGHSADHLLCDAELNAEFRIECKRRRLPGSGFFWNRIMLRLRKAGRLPKSNRNATRTTFAEMDAYSFASEIAMRQLEVDYNLTTDDILCSPDAAEEFDRVAAEFSPGYSSFEYRWAALAIRKRANQSRKIGLTKFGEWLEETKKLPNALPIEKVDHKCLEKPGAYIFETADQQTLYVGEALNVSSRVKLAVESESWKRLRLSSVRFVENTPQDSHGLQSILVRRRSPMLNSGLLYPSEV
ncbi:MAG: site-specific DNA-methyltransferase [Planctomycetales bacterium]|nr:site-specific DNA-methyltransferase [Planctomycetales bacterium]